MEKELLFTLQMEEPAEETPEEGVEAPKEEEQM